MRMRFALAVLAAWLGSVPARAGAITDLDGWAKSFTAAAGRTDTEAMTALIRQVVLKDALMDIVERNNPNIQKYFGGHRVVYAEQFENRHIGDIRYRINVVVQYVDTQTFYSVAFMKLQDGWQLYAYDSHPDINTILKLDW